MLPVALMAALSLAVAPQPHAKTCTEDMPCWNWTTMGDHRRGVVTMWGTPKVVSCGDLRWLIRHGDLDPHTPRLRGDGACGRA